MDSRSHGPRVRTDPLCRVHAPRRPQETNKEEKNHAAFEISHHTRIGARIYRRKPQETQGQKEIGISKNTRARTHRAAAAAAAVASEEEKRRASDRQVSE